MEVKKVNVYNLYIINIRKTGCGVLKQVKGSNNEFNRTLNHSLLSLVLPIAFQNLISAAAIAVDVIMLGVINQSVMSAVSLAGQVTFVLSLFYMGISTGAGILTAQYWGRNDVKVIQRVFSITSIFSLSISVIFFLFSFCFPEFLMRLLTNDAELIHYGAIFLRTVSFSYIAMGISQVYFSVLKSMENARFSAWISSICLFLNIGLNALCVYVFFPGMPEKAILGVALATVCARCVELGCCVVHSIRYSKVKFHLPGKDRINRQLRKDFLKYTIPIQANYFVWGGGLTVATSIIGHVSADMVAANSIATVVRNLAIVFCAGISSGGAVLIGKYLGTNDKLMAIKASKRINLYALILGIVAGVSILVIKPLVSLVVELNDISQSYLDGMLYVCAYYCVGKSINSTIIGGFFPAGGDAKFGLWCDIVVMWIIVLPLAYLCAFVWHVHPILLYVVINLDEIFKLPLAVYRYSQYKWLKNITRDVAL
ncbi:MATE family efflux transporter [Niallia taxi]|uniref:MATE family efflux transporter n=1 Tax=Niallia taxi TaxID=2499688 RepID=A0A437K4P4_9BACI|nr:MATE family efflux transporter [Niallia taxi]